MSNTPSSVARVAAWVAQPETKHLLAATAARAAVKAARIRDQAQIERRILHEPMDL